MNKGAKARTTRSAFMRVFAGVSAAVALVGAAGCAGRGIEVNTEVAPNAQFAGRSTFRVLDVPAPRKSLMLAADDPMLASSITYRAIHDELEHAFRDRGYVESPKSADLDVAYYATSAPKLDIRTYDYGYTWRGFPREYTEVNEYEQGTVIVDVVDPKTHELLWRGLGVARLNAGPTDSYANELRNAVNEIVRRFPAMTPQATAKTGYR